MRHRKVVDAICSEIPGCDEVMRQTIATHVLAHAQKGERNFDALVRRSRLTVA